MLYPPLSIVHGKFQSGRCQDLDRPPFPNEGSDMCQTAWDWKTTPENVANYHPYTSDWLFSCFPRQLSKWQCLPVCPNDNFRVSLKVASSYCRFRGENTLSVIIRCCLKLALVLSPLGGVTILWLKCLYHFDTLPSRLIWCWKRQLKVIGPSLNSTEDFT